MKLQDFFTGNYKTCLKPDEVIIDVLLPFSTPVAASFDFMSLFEFELKFAVCSFILLIYASQ